jgi:hypothetical protein
MTTAHHLEELRAQARYRRDRLDLYRARVHGSRPTSPARLEELTREHELAVSSLKRAAGSAALSP